MDTASPKLRFGSPSRVKSDRRGTLFGHLVVSSEGHEKDSLRMSLLECENSLKDSGVENPEAVHNNMANVMMKLGDVKGALEHYSEALNLTGSKDPAVLMNMGVAFKHLERWSEAVDHFRRALLIRPTADSHYNLANTLLNSDPDGNLAEATKHYEECLRMDPGHANAHMNLGTAMKGGGGDLDGAIVEFRR